MRENQVWRSTRFNSWSIIFPFCINDLPKITTKNVKYFPYADDTTIIVTNLSHKDFKINMSKVFVDVNEWFKTNLLTLNFKKTHYLQLRTKNSQEINVLYQL